MDKLLDTVQHSVDPLAKIFKNGSLNILPRGLCCFCHKLMQAAHHDHCKILYSDAQCQKGNALCIEAGTGK